MQMIVDKLMQLKYVEPIKAKTVRYRLKKRGSNLGNTSSGADPKEITSWLSYLFLTFVLDSYLG